MSFTYDVTTEAGRVRMLIADTNADTAIFTDAEIEAFLALASGVFRAGALALDTMASNEAMVQKAIKLLDLQTNGPAVAKALRDHAATLRSQADETEAGAQFDIAENPIGDFAEREYAWNEALSGS